MPTSSFRRILCDKISINSANRQADRKILFAAFRPLFRGAVANEEFRPRHRLRRRARHGGPDANFDSTSANRGIVENISYFCGNFSDYGIETRFIQYAFPPQGGVRAAGSFPCGHVRLRADGLRRSSSGARASGCDLRPAVPLSASARLQGALRAQHHRRGASGTRRRRRRGQDHEEGAARTARTDGGGALLHGALPSGDGCAGRAQPLDRAAGFGAYYRAGGLRAEDSRCGLRLRVERIGLFRCGEVRPRPPLRRPFGAQSGRHRGQHARAGRAVRQTQLLRLRAVEKGVARTHHALAFAVERRVPRLAHGVLGHEHQVSGRTVRHPRRRHGPDVPAPRVRPPRWDTIRRSTGCTTT